VSTTVAATFCATLADEWARAGVTAAFVAPGSRSTPLALALAAEPRIAVHLFHDERASAYAALGHGLATGRPGVVLCSSGTAGTHIHGAVVEADLSGVPMVVCTADRPPELWHIGAPQTIDQNRLYGSAARFYAEPGVPDGALAPTWRSLASRLVAEAVGWRNRPGPVHANLSFRDPLVGQPGELPPGRDGGAPWHRVTPIGTSSQPPADAVAELVDRLVATSSEGVVARPGIIMAGRGTSDPAAVADLARRLGWPVLADHRSGCRTGPPAVGHAESLARVGALTDRTAVEVLLRVGEPLSSKALSQWIARSGADVISLVEDGRWLDPERAAGAVVAGTGWLPALMSALPATVTPASTGRDWLEADARAAAAIEAALAASTGVAARAVDEISLARRVVAEVPAGGALVVSSSMPVRDVEWFGPARSDLTVHANRGANGIDGVVSTAVGVALTGAPTTVLIGDVAFLHDSTALIGLADRDVDLHIVVADNDGGGIFSFLPQATEIEGTTFEALFGTPHGTDLAALAAAHHLPVVSWPPAPSRSPGGATSTGSEPGSGTGALGGPRISVVPTTGRAANVAIHDTVHDAVTEALRHLVG
jgi:2-succinyl-5-enolpyruvyl-6-hydroxy-3-cyclohexene-1-carboxylate synthase